MNAGITHCRSSTSREYVCHGLKDDYILFWGVVAQSVCLGRLGNIMCEMSVFYAKCVYG